MSLKSLMNGVAVAAVAMAAVASVPSAEAREWRRGSHTESHGGPGSGGGHYDGGRGSYVNRWGDVRGGHRGEGRGSFAHGRSQRWNGGHDSRREPDGYGHGSDRHGRDHTARNVAIGAFAAVLGLALAAESQRVREEYYDERD